MTLRSQVIAAWAVLLIGLIAVLVLVNTGDVQSDVVPAFLGSGDNWVAVEGQDGLWTHTDEAVAAQISVSEKSLDQIVLEYGVEPLADDSATPGLDILTQLGSALDEQLAAQFSTISDSASDSYAVDLPSPGLRNGVSIPVLHLTYKEGVVSSYPAGLDLALGMVDLGEDQIRIVELMIESGPNDGVYADFEAWLYDNAKLLATPTPGPWANVGPNQLTYKANSDVTIQHTPVTVDEIVATLTLEEGAPIPSTPLDLLNAMKDGIVAQYEEIYGEAISDGAIGGPDSATYGDVEVAEMRMHFDAETDSETGVETPAQTSRQILIDLGDGNLYLVQFIVSGDVDPQVEADFETWMNENAPIFAGTDSASDGGE